MHITLNQENTTANTGVKIYHEMPNYAPEKEKDPMRQLQWSVITRLTDLLKKLQAKVGNRN